MAKKVSSANVKITSVLKSILQSSSGIISNNSVINTKGTLAADLEMKGGVWGAAGRTTSPIDHIGFQEIDKVLSFKFDDVTGVLDFVSTFVDKAFFESLTSTDSITSKSLHKSFFEDNIAQDSIFISLDFTRSFAETLISSDFSSLDYHKAQSETLLASDFSSLDYHKSRSDSVTITEDITSFSLIKSFADQAIVIDDASITDGSTYEFVKFLKEFIYQSEHRYVDLHKPLSDSPNVSELAAIDYTKPLSDSVSTSDSFSKYMLFARFIDDTISESDTVNLSYNKVLSDLQQAEDRPYKGFEKAPINEEPLVASDDFTNVITFVRTFNDLVTILDAITTKQVNLAKADSSIPIDNIEITDGSTFDLIHVAKDTLDSPIDLFARVVQFNKSNSETVLTTTTTALDTTKPLSDSSTQVEGPGFEDGYVKFYYATDYYVSRRRFVFDLNKVLADEAIVIDNAAIFDGSNFEFTAVYKDYQSTTDSIYIGPTYFNRTYTDVTEPVVDRPYKGFVKAPIHDNIRNFMYEGPKSLLTNDYITDYFETTIDAYGQWVDEYAMEVGPSFDFTKVIHDSVTIVDYLSMSWLRQDTSIILDIHAVDLTKPLSDIAYGYDGVIAITEDYYCIDYFPDTYIADLISSVSKHFYKALADFVTALDDANVINTYGFDPQYASTLDETSFVAHKVLTDYPLTDDSYFSSVTKPLSDFERATEGPGYGDSNDYSADYTGPLYTAKARPIWSMHKPLSDSLTEPDRPYITIIKGPSSFTDSVTPPDTIKLYPQLAKVDSVTASEDISTFYITLYKADSVEAVDLAGVFDGSTYSLSLVKNETITTSDYHISYFTKPLSEVLVILDDGDQFTYSVHKPFTETLSVPIGPAYYYTEDYASGYFNPLEGEYAELGRPIFDITLVKADSITASEDISTFDVTLTKADSVIASEDISTFNIILRKSDLVTASEDISTFNFIKVLADSVTILDQIGALGGAITFPDSTTILEDSIFDVILAKSDSITASEDISTFNFNKLIDDTIDTVITSDDSTFNFNKLIDDTIDTVITSDDSTFNLIKLLSDSVIPEDLTGVFDGSTYTFIKTVHETVVTTVDLSRSFNKVLNNLETIGIPIDQQPSFHFVLSASDIVTAIDELTDIAGVNEGFTYTDLTDGATDSGTILLDTYFENAFDYFEANDVYIGQSSTFSS